MHLVRTFCGFILVPESACDREFAGTITGSYLKFVKGGKINAYI
jgi:hypothetical protein